MVPGKLVILGLLVGISIVCNIHGSPVHYIVGGNFARVADAPWQVAILRDGAIHCGGSIINNKWIITGAHCFYFYQYDPINIWTVAITTEDLLSLNESNVYPLKSIAIHNRFNNPDYSNDIALLELEKPINFNQTDARPIQLATKDDKIKGSTCAVFGYGKTKISWWSSKLKRAEVPLFNPIKCQDMHCVETAEGEILPVYKSNVCAGYAEGGQDACQGDSGGGLICYGVNAEQYLVGIISHGKGCGLKARPGIYTRVSMYIDWVNLIESGQDQQTHYKMNATLVERYKLCPAELFK